MTTPPDKRVTMKTLAEQLGVTKTTISLALRDHHSISESMRERVVKLAHELNYRPDPAIAAIAARRWSCGSSERHRVLAFLCHHKKDGRMLQIDYFPGAKLRADELGYKLEPFFVDDYPNAEAVNRVLYSRGIRGLLIPPIHNPDSKRIMNLDWSRFTAVCCGIGRIRPPVHTVCTDQFVTTRMIWEIVAKAGFKRIGAAIFYHDPVADEDWLRIGATTAAARMLKLSEAGEIPILTTHMLDEEALLSWYHQYKPEVIISFNHVTGEILERNGIRIPDDVQLVALFAPIGSRWSGLEHHYDKVGRTSIDVLNTELRDNNWGLPELPNLILIHPEWNHGSTYTPPVEPALATINRETEHKVKHISNNQKPSFNLVQAATGKQK